MGKRLFVDMAGRLIRKRSYVRRNCEGQGRQERCRHASTPNQPCHSTILCRFIWRCESNYCTVEFLPGAIQVLDLSLGRCPLMQEEDTVRDGAHLVGNSEGVHGPGTCLGPWEGRTLSIAVKSGVMDEASQTERPLPVGVRWQTPVLVSWS